MNVWDEEEGECKPYNGSTVKLYYSRKVLFIYELWLFQPWRGQRITEFLWSQETIFKVREKVVKRLLAFGAMLFLF